MSSELTKEDIFRMFAETDRRFEETDKTIEELASPFMSQWGKLIEALVKPSALKLFQERGIKVGADKNFGDDIQRRRYP